MIKLTGPRPASSNLRMRGVSCEANLNTSEVVMRHCAYCKKHPSVGNNVSHANNKTKRRWNPNLQEVRAEVGGNVRRVLVCTRCIRSGKVKKSA